MTTTLTWHVKPIVFPRVNSNLLAVVGLIIICTMAFAMIHPALASHCGPEESALDAALLDLAVATGILVAALLTGGWALVAALANHLRATKSVDAAQEALTRCENQHNGSGSCG